MTGSSLKLIQKVMKDLRSRFKRKDLEELKYFLGIEFSRSKKGILMNQKKYALEIVSAIGLAGRKPMVIPLEFNYKLTSVDFDKFMNNDNIGAI